MILGILLSPFAAEARVVFTDDFARPDGSVGNGWTSAPGASTPALVIYDERLTTQGTGTPSSAIFRPADFSQGILLSAVLTQESGYYGNLLGRYQGGFIVFGDGAPSDGYYIDFGRGDDNYADSGVDMFLNGSLVSQVNAPFQFGPSIFVEIYLSPTDQVEGLIEEGAQHYTFELGQITPLVGNDQVGVLLGEPNPTTFPYTSPTLDNFTMVEAPDISVFPALTEPDAWIMLILGSWLVGGSLRQQKSSRNFRIAVTTCQSGEAWTQQLRSI